MRRAITILAAAAALAVAAIAPGAAVAESGSPSPRVVATFPTGYEYNSFAESLAIDRAGNLFVSVTIWTDGSWNRGQLWKISPDGRMRQLGKDLDVGILSGLAFDEDGNLYAGLVTFDTNDVPSGVLQFAPNGRATRVVTLPPGSFPNGLAFHDGDLYISDSWNGAVWRAHPRAGRNRCSARRPGCRTRRSRSSAAGRASMGSRSGATRCMAVNADTGSVVRIPVRRNGSHGLPTVVVTDPALVGSDGIAFDEQGGLWIAVNHGDEDAGGALLRMSRTGSLSVVANDPGWLDYPSQPAFGVRPGDATTLYVVNGSLNTGNCNVIALSVSVRGQPLP